MAFSSWDELINMSAKDPETAKRYVDKARMAGRKPVDADNPGYSQLSSTMPGKPGTAAKGPVDPNKQDAIRRRLKTKDSSQLYS